MANDAWARMPLGQFVTLQRGHDLPDARRRPGRVPILGSFGITGWHDEWRAVGPGVTVGRSGASFGVVSYSAVNFWPLNTALYVIDFHGNDPRFAYYFLKMFDFQRYNSGSAQPSLNRNFVHPVPVEVPSLDEQRAIAHVLGTLDDKIELNRRMNETLEAMARALFKSWFVDFDPVRAKVEGRDPELPKALADLFPDGFEESELGEVPRGWPVVRLDQVLVLQRGFDLPATTRTPGQYPVIAASGPSGTHSEFRIAGPGVATGRSGVLGRVFYVHDDYWPLNTSLWVSQFRHSTPAYAFHVLQQLDFGIFNAGSAVPTLNRNHVHSLPTLMPPMSAIHAFDAAVVPMMRRQKAGDDEVRTLAALRDTLLPKLISGALRVADIGRVIAEPRL